MSSKCNAIVFKMEEKEQKWDSVLSLENASSVSMENKMLVETGEEEVLIRIVRKTKASSDYAASVKLTRRLLMGEEE